jgi:hypothetical protein
VSRGTQGAYSHQASAGVAYRTLTVCGRPSQAVRLAPPTCPVRRHALLPGHPSDPYAPTTPARTRSCPRIHPVWAQAGSLATTTALSYLISSPRGTEMFQFPRCPSARLCIQRPIRRLAPPWVAPFGFDRLIACMQLPGHVSPLSASFFGSRPLGIHPVPRSAWQFFSEIARNPRAPPRIVPSVR